MAASMTYGGYSFDPVPLLSFSKERVRDTNDNKMFDRVTLSCNGYLLNPNGNFGKLDDQFFTPLKNALSVDHQELIITHESGVFVSGVYPKVEGFQTETDSVWVDKLKYSFNFLWQEDIQTGYEVESYSDNWQWSEQEADVATLSHTVQAKGINTNPSGSSNAFSNAVNFVTSRLGISNIPSGYPLNILSSYSDRSYIRRLYSETVDEPNGTYSVTENFVFASGLNNYYIHNNKFSFSTDQKGITTVQVQGEIQGDGSSSSERDSNAASGWAVIEPTIYSSASGVYSDLGYTRVLNSEPISKSVSRNKYSGKIDYTYNFTDKINDINAVGIIDASWTVQKNNPVKTWASIPVPGKVDGPVWQDIKTVSEGTYTLSGEVIAKNINDAISYAQKIINNYGGQSIGTDRRITSQSITKDYQGNSVQFSISWAFKSDPATSILV